jgi:hypothetical protein
MRGKQRGKDKIGWNGVVVDIVFKNGERYFSSPENFFIKAFSEKYSLNQNCTGCKYAYFPRQGDFSIGDFWGVDNYDKTLNDKLGTSVVFINNKKAAGILKNIENKCKLLTEIPVEAAARFNVINKCSPLNISRSYFFHHLDDMIFHLLVEKISRNKAVYDVGIVGLPVRPNFGSALSYYALYKTIGVGGGGHSVKMIGIDNYPMKSVFESAPYTSGELEVYCTNKKDLEYLNGVVDMFVVGSDQLFHDILLNQFKDLVYLDWVKDSHKKIAYAASFGHDEFSGTEERRADLAHYIQKYDAFSVREESGVELLKKQFGKEAVQVLDPVFLCEKEEFVKLAEKTKTKSDKPHIYGYILDPNNDTREIIKYASENLQLPPKHTVKCSLGLETRKIFIPNTSRVLLKNGFTALVPARLSYAILSTGHASR